MFCARSGKRHRRRRAVSADASSVSSRGPPVSEYRKGENPARWRGHLSEMLPAKSKIHRVEHHKAIPYPELPAFMQRLRTFDSISARALETTILCAARTNETIGARWSEIDLKEKVWT